MTSSQLLQVVVFRGFLFSFVTVVLGVWLISYQATFQASTASVVQPKAQFKFGHETRVPILALDAAGEEFGVGLFSRDLAIATSAGRAGHSSAATPASGLLSDRTDAISAGVNEVRTREVVKEQSRADRNRSGSQYDPGKVRLGDPRLRVGTGTAAIAVPFYIYAEAHFDWIHTCPSQEEPLGEHKLFKHGNDAWFAEQIQEHPWRVHDPEAAMIFVVPVMLTWSSRNKKCRGRSAGSLLKHISMSVLNKPYWRRHNGTDHMVVSTDFRIYMTHSKWMAKLFPGFIYGVQLNVWHKKLQASCAFAVPVSCISVTCAALCKQ
jgi:hypothetical protein